MKYTAIIQKSEATGIISLQPSVQVLTREPCLFLYRHRGEIT